MWHRHFLATVRIFLFHLVYYSILPRKSILFKQTMWLKIIFVFLSSVIFALDLIIKTKLRCHLGYPFF